MEPLDLSWLDLSWPEKLFELNGHHRSNFYPSAENRIDVTNAQKALRGMMNISKAKVITERFNLQLING